MLLLCLAVTKQAEAEGFGRALIDSEQLRPAACSQCDTKLYKWLDSRLTKARWTNEKYESRAQ